MGRRRFKRLFHSAFTKLLVTILVAGVAITLIVLVGFSLVRFQGLSYLNRNLRLYAEYMIRDMGDPPEYDRAAEIARRTGFSIRFDHPGRGWQIGKVPGSLNLDRAWMRRHDNGVWTGYHHGHVIIRLHHGGGDLLFIGARSGKNHENAGWVLAFMTAGLLVILTAAYLYIRRVLKPLRTLQSGVEALTTGRLDHRVAVAGDDEFQDLTEALNTMAKRLSDLLTSKEHLLLDMSHELRSPLTRMKVQLEFLPADEAREALRADVAEMETMVSTILEEARLRGSATALNLAEIELSQLIRSVGDDFKDRSPGIVTGALEPIRLRADGEKMRMVVRNLLDNAMKHTPAGGDPVTIAMARQKEAVDIVIQDHGEGIPAAALPHLFDPFFRVDSSRSRKTGGYGLGLSLCKAVIDAHKGRIDISSIPAEGTRVVISLPLP
jgi:signal transduction histidine kinase